VFAFATTCESKKNNLEYIINKKIVNNVPYYILKTINCEFKTDINVNVLYSHGPSNSIFILFNNKKTKAIKIDEFKNKITYLDFWEMECLKELKISNIVSVLNKKDLYPKRVISSYIIIGFAKFTKKKIDYEIQKKLFNIRKKDIISCKLNCLFQ
jgi:hypothetical protein